jgi:hypothetical protein
MRRRDFLHTTSLAIVAAAGLPEPVRRTKANTPSLYKTTIQSGVNNQLLYELGLYHNTVQNFNSSTEEEKAIGFKVKYYETATQATPAKTGEFKYIILRSEIADKESNLWKLTTRLDKKISGDYIFPREYPANFNFLCMPGFFVKVLGNNNSVLISIPYPVTTSSSSYDDDYDGGDCFLTTACTQYRHLPDNCEELTALRFLRNNYMMTGSGGQAMISQYKSIGPAIVKAINSLDNKAAIYEYMYSNMIIPSVKLVQQGDYAEAVNYYRLFVEALQDRYCS